MKNTGSSKTKLLVAEETSFINRQALAITQEKGKKGERSNQYFKNTWNYVSVMLQNAK